MYRKANRKSQKLSPLEKWLINFQVCQFLFNAMVNSETGKGIKYSAYIFFYKTYLCISIFLYKV